MFEAKALGNDLALGRPVLHGAPQDLRPLIRRAVYAEG